MDLRGLNLPKGKAMKITISEQLKSLKHYFNLESYIPPMKQLFDLSRNEGITFENNYVITGLNISNDDNIKGNCSINVLDNGITKKLDVYLKVTHLIDPIRSLQKKYEAVSIEDKIQNYWNQAYVETVASYIFGKLRNENISLHFNLFYGAFTSIAKTYNYNVSDEIESYRMYRWFWDSVESKSLKINIEGEDPEHAKEMYDEIMVKPEYCLDTKDGDVEELEGYENNECYEVKSLDSASIQTQTTLSTTLTSEEEDDDEDEDEYKVFIQLPNFPVMMIFTEKNVSTMDDLLEDFETVGAKPNTKLWDEKWTAWLFQVIAGLCVAQTLFAFTHNDLHTNNIVWSSTEEKYIYYKTNNNTIFRVPTYGKIFKIIDFGRSIFSVNEHTFISDDFCEGNDAATQYNFPPLVPESDEPRVYPNSSFDLTRLSISLFEPLFPTTPEEKNNGAILSQEEGRIVKETKSDLYNILWMWLIDNEGKNILYDEDNDERFPDFDLYIHISSSCFNGIPKEQIYKKPFNKFIIDSKIPKNVKLYSLYV